jgi:hypothetical protein
MTNANGGHGVCMLYVWVCMYSGEGASSLYRGLTPAVLRQSLCGGIGVGFYQPVTKRMTSAHNPHTLTLIASQLELLAQPIGQGHVMRTIFCGFGTPSSQDHRRYHTIPYDANE